MSKGVRAAFLQKACFFFFGPLVLFGVIVSPAGIPKWGLMILIILGFLSSYYWLRLAFLPIISYKEGDWRIETFAGSVTTEGKITALYLDAPTTKWRGVCTRIYIEKPETATRKIYGFRVRAKSQYNIWLLARERALDIINLIKEVQGDSTENFQHPEVVKANSSPNENVVINPTYDKVHRLKDK